MISQKSDSLKFFSPQRNFKSSIGRVAHHFTPNTHAIPSDYQSFSKSKFQGVSSQTQEKNLEKEVEKVSQSYDECRSEIVILKEKFKKIEDSKNNSQSYAEENYEFLGGSDINNSRGTVREKDAEFGLTLKEWKIKKTNEMIEKFESQAQALLKENEKNMRVLRQKQNEIEKLKALNFTSNCKMKEYESKLELMKEELDHSFQLLKEREDDLENWKYKYFETEQKVATMDSMEFKLMENEYLLLDYQKKMEYMIEENERIKLFNNSADFNEKLKMIIDGIDSIYKNIAFNPNNQKTPDTMTGISFSTPEKLKEESLESIYSQLKMIESFISNSKSNSSPNEKLIKQFEKELEREKQEKNALNSKITFLNNTKFKNKEADKERPPITNHDPNIQDLEKEINSLKTSFQKEENRSKELRSELEKIKKEKESFDNSKNASMESENFKLNLNLNEMEKDMEILKSELLSKNQEIKELEKNIKENNKEKIINEMSKKHQQNEQNIQKLKQELLNLEIKHNEELGEKENITKAIEEELRESFEKLEEFEKINSNLKKEKDQLNLELKEKSQRLKDLDRKFSQISQSNQKNKEEMQELAKDINEKNKKIEELEKINNEFIENIDNYKEFEKNYQKLESKSQKEKEKNSNDLSEKNKKIKELEKQVLDLQIINEVFQNRQLEHDDLKLKNKEIISENQELINKNKEIAQTINESLKELEDKNNLIKELQNKLLHNENSDNKNNLNFLQSNDSKLKESTNIMNDLKIKNQETLKENQELQIKITKLEQLIELHNDLQLKLLTEKEKNQNLENKCFIIENDKLLNLNKIKELEIFTNELNEKLENFTNLPISKEPESIENIQLKERLIDLNSQIIDLSNKLKKEIEIKESFHLKLQGQDDFINGCEAEKNNIKEEILRFNSRINLLETENEIQTKKNQELILEIERKREELTIVNSEKEKIKKLNHNNEILFENKEKYIMESEEMQKVVQKLNEELTISQKKCIFLVESLEKTRKETRLLFLMAVGVILIISLLFFMS